MFTTKELDDLERDARRPDYGSRYYKPDVVLRLIAHIRELEPKQQSLFTEQSIYSDDAKETENHCG